MFSQNKWRFLIIIIPSIILLVGVSLYIYTRSKKFENLTFIVEKPHSLPDVKLGLDYFEKDAYTALEGANEDEAICIIYTRKNDREATKFIVFMNAFFLTKDHQIEEIAILYDNLPARQVMEQVLKLIPNSQMFNKNNLTFHDGHKMTQDEKILFLNQTQRVLYPCFLHEKNKDMISLLNQMNIQIFDYITMIDDMNKIFHTFPISEIYTIHMEKIFPKKKEINYIHKFIAFDNILFVKESGHLYKNKTALDLLQKYYLLQSFDPKKDTATLNLYQKLGYNVHTPIRDKKKRVESFIDNDDTLKSITIESNRHLDLTFENFIKPLLFKSFSFHEEYINDVQLKEGDTLKLVGQQHKIENDTYKVVQIKKNTMFASNFQIKTYIKNGIDLDWNDDHIKTINIDFKNNVKTFRVSKEHPDAIGNNKHLIVIGFPVFMKDPLNLSGEVTKVELSYFDVVVQSIESKNTILNMYECYGYAKIKTKEACEDDNSFEMQIENDLHGKGGAESNNKRRGVWDRRCVSNLECPFFEKNANGYRGGCLNGYCELPVGLKRTSYRKYDINENSFPFCQSCPTSNKQEMINCCESEKIKNKNQDKYVFPI